MGTMAYKLKLPPHSVVHPVFHVSLMKKVTGPLPSQSSVLPPDDTSMQTPELVLDRRLKNKHNRVIVQLLVKWMGWPAELATWEDQDSFLLRFPEASTWSQVVSQGEEDVTNHPVKLSKVQGNKGPVQGGTRKVASNRVKKPSVHITGPEWAC